MTKPSNSQSFGQSEIPLESPVPFVDRRNTGVERRSAGIERRQFTNSYEELSPEAGDLGRAVDQFKLDHHRRYINYEELLSIIQGLGYVRKT